jgi:hypothetical protein
LGAVNVDEQAQIQLLALSLKELIQSSAMTALDQLFVFLAVIMRSLGEIRCHGGNPVSVHHSCPKRRTDTGLREKMN